MLRFPLAVTIDTNIFDATKYDFSESNFIGVTLFIINCK